MMSVCIYCAVKICSEIESFVESICIVVMHVYMHAHMYVCWKTRENMYVLFYIKDPDYFHNSRSVLATCGIVRMFAVDILV